MKKQRLLFIFFSAVLLPAYAPVGVWSAALVSAATVSLPATGQTKCYNSSGNEIACTGTGQDGDKNMGVSWPNPRFTVTHGNSIYSLDKCVTDNLTGLMWPQDANLPTAIQTWQQALDYAASLNLVGGLCGYTDWRLPQILELESLVESCGASTCGFNVDWLNTHGFANTQSEYYWSSGTYVGGTTYAWCINMRNGIMDFKPKTDRYYVWPVRGGGYAAPAEVWATGQTKCYDTSGYEIACSGTKQDGDARAGVAWPNPRFADNGNGAVTDNLTGLIWLKNANCFTKLWQGALDAANGLANGQCGLSDGSQAGNWRLPNRKELLSLVDFSNVPLSLPTGHPFIDVQFVYRYWSSSTFVDTYLYNNAVTIHMGRGYTGADNKTTVDYVWPVRGGGSLGNLVLSSTSQTLTPPGGTARITVTDSSNTISWTTISSLNWVTITSGSSGTGNGTVTISVSANTTGATRTGNITIAGQTVVITQSAGSAVSLVTTTAQTSYSTIQAAYDANTAASGSTIKVQGTTLTETLVFSQNNTLTLTGGYDSTFTTVGSTMTTVSGSLTISGGAVTVANIVIQ